MSRRTGSPAGACHRAALRADPLAGDDRGANSVMVPRHDKSAFLHPRSRRFHSHPGPMTPFVHVATGADFASPFANAGDQGLGYINSDVTLYLHRLPVTNWIGFEVVNHHATDGVAIGECWLYDEKGPIGTSTVAALAQRKPMATPPPP